MFWRLGFLTLFFLSLSYAADSNITKRLEAINKRLDLHEKKLTFTHDDTYFAIGGRIRLDLVFNDSSVGQSGGNSAYDFYVTPKSITDLGQSNELAMQAKDSRLWFKTRRETPYGRLHTLIEVDFLGSAGDEKVTNSHNIRLRHAYVTLNGLTLGQTYSTFMGSGASDSVQGAVDILLVRQPLIRYAKLFGQTKVEVALESPETTYFSQDLNASQSANDDQIPDITARIKHQTSFGELSLALLGRQLRISDLNSSAASQTSFAYHLSGRIQGFGNDKISFSFAQGTGMGRYVAYNYFPSAVLNSQNKLTLLPMNAYHLAYQHWWSKKLRSSLLYGRVEIDNDLSVFDTTATKNSDSLHANIRFSPFSNALLTLEYIHARKVDEAGNSTLLDRLYFSSSYDF